jgi:microcystin-dependent protein
MSDPFIGEIRIFAGNFAPKNWAMCDGQILSIASNTALFSLFGTMYGGNGQTTFALPDLRGRSPLHAGAGPGLSSHSQGSLGGVPSVTLTAAELPPHSHDLRATDGFASTHDAADNALAANRAGTYSASAATAAMHASAVGSAGGGQPHPNMQPYLALNFIVALAGIYPTQS